MQLSMFWNGEIVYKQNLGHLSWIYYIYWNLLNLRFCQGLALGVASFFNEICKSFLKKEFTQLMLTYSWLYCDPVEEINTAKYR